MERDWEEYTDITLQPSPVYVIQLISHLYIQDLIRAM